MMLARLLRWLFAVTVEVHDLMADDKGSTVTPWSLRSVLPREEPRNTGTTEALYPASGEAPCGKCRLLRDPRELRGEKRWCSSCIAKEERRVKRAESRRLADQRKAEERRGEELRLAEAQRLVVRMPERGRI